MMGGNEIHKRGLLEPAWEYVERIQALKDNKEQLFTQENVNKILENSGFAHKDPKVKHSSAYFINKLLGL